ncbi:hypothetical protein [Inquilinus sp. OTU3971]|uniref:hypothetical protein n=1 Tax=Inquilinus sp. OTU3971 TaxID=3043855 RepID=UPI00313B58EC
MSDYIVTAKLNTGDVITIPLDADAGQAVLAEIKNNTLLSGDRVSIVGTDSGLVTASSNVQHLTVLPAPTAAVAA